MQISEQSLRSAHFFAGAGGDMCGFSLAGLRPTFAVEINQSRCKTLRLNFPQCKIFEGPIQHVLLANYPSGEIPIFFITFPCDRYTLAANIHGTCTGDALYLEALREVVLPTRCATSCKQVSRKKMSRATERDLSQESEVTGQNIITIPENENRLLPLLERLAEMKPIDLSKSSRQTMKRDRHWGRRGWMGITREPLLPGQAPMRML